jgi:hypothetical protein
VAVGLSAALGWNAQGDPDSYTDAGIAMGCDVDEIDEVFARLCADSGLDAAVGSLEPALSVDDIASTMNAVENQAMLHNNARPVSDDDRVLLARRTVELWNRLLA